MAGSPLQASPLYWTSFDGTAGDIPADWQVLAGTTGTPGWRIDPDGEYRYDDTEPQNALSHYTGDFSNGQPGNSFTDGTVEATFRRSDTNVVGLAARLQNSGAFYHARLWHNNLELYRFGGTGGIAELSSTPAPGYESGQSWTISMTLLGTSISASLFDQFGSPVATVSATDTNFTSGTVGVRGQATSIWEDFLVTAPPDLNVDIGLQGAGSVQAGFQSFTETNNSGNYSTSPKAQWLDSQLGNANRVQVELASGSGGGRIGFRQRSNVTHAMGDLAEDFVFNFDGDRLNLTVGGLLPGYYEMTTYHHDSDNYMTGTLDVSVSDARSSGRSAAQGVTVTNGTEPATIGRKARPDRESKESEKIMSDHRSPSKCIIAMLAMVIIVAAAVPAVRASDYVEYRWYGTAENNEFDDPANWRYSQVPSAGEMINGRIFVDAQWSEQRKLIYGEDQGHTTFAPTSNRGLFLSRGRMEITGGTYESRPTTSNGDGMVLVGDTELVVNGGAYGNNAVTSSHNRFQVVYGRDDSETNYTGALTIKDGSFTVNELRYGSSSSRYGTGIVNLEGGTLAVNRVYQVTSPVTSIFNFNGGTLQVRNAHGDMSDLDEVYIRSGGAVIDTNGYNFAVNPKLLDGGGSGSLIKQGEGTLTLAGENTYTGATNVDEGALRITHSNALGAGDVTVASDARLELAGNITVTGQALTMSGRGGNNIGALQTQSGQNTWAGNVTIGAGETRIGASGTGNTLTISGVIDDGGENGTLAVRNNNGTTILSGENTYGGNTDVVIGLLQVDGGDNRLPIDSVLRMGYTAGSAAAAFDLNGWNQEVAGLLSRADTMPLTVMNSNSETLSTLMVNNTGTHTYVGDVTDNLALTKTGAGTLVLSGENDYSGATSVDEGVLRIDAADALGTGEITVADGAGLELAGGITVTESVTISGWGHNNTGALQSHSGENTWAGDVTLGADGARVGAWHAGRTLTISGAIGDGGNNYTLTMRNRGEGVTILSGENTYGGNTNVVIGLMRIDGGDDRLPIGSELHMGNASNYESATFDLNGRNQQVAGLRSLGTTMPMEVTNSSATTPSILTVNHTGTHTYVGDITGNLALTMTGAGTLVLGGDNTHTGLTTVDAGTLHVTGSLAHGGSSHVRVASAGTAFGAGDPTIIRQVDAGGSFAGIGSQVVGPDTFATQADLRAGGNGGNGALDLGMAWRAVGGDDAAALPPLHDLVSDVLRLDGMDDGNGQTNPFVLQMSYDSGLLQPHQDGMFLAWLSSADGWMNAVEGNIGMGGSAVANFQSASGGYAAGSWDAFVDAYSPIDLDSYLGSWGVDSANQLAWAVLNHNSRFAVMAVPEPSALLLGGMGLLGLLLIGRRRR